MPNVAVLFSYIQWGCPAPGCLCVKCMWLPLGVLKVLALSLKPGTCLLNLCHSFKIHCSQFTLYSEMLLSSGKVGIGTIKESLYPFHWGLCFTWCILSTIHIYWQAWKYHVHEWNMYFLDITEWSILSAFIGTFSGK